MPIVNLEYPKFRALDALGNPLSLGKVEVFLAGTSTQATTYTDAVRTAQNTNPVILSSAGEAEIWFDVAVDVEIRDSSDVLQDKILGLAANLSPTVTGNFNLVLNGSFETDEDADTVPDNWTVSEEANGVIAIDSTVQAHGHNSLKFDGGGSGGGTATSTKFDALTGGDVAIQFTYKSSHTGTTNSVQINWYDENDAKVGATITVHTDSATNPTAFTTYNYVETVPATAIQGELILTGVSSGGAQLSGDTWFDDVKIIDVNPVVTPLATQTLTNKTLTSPVINTPTITANSEDITSGGQPVYGLKYLDNAELLTGADPTENTWISSSTFASTTLTTADAKKAILRFSYFTSKVSTATGNFTSEMYFRIAGGTDTIAQTKVAENNDNNHTIGNTLFGNVVGNNVVVNLDSNNDFEFYASPILSSATGTIFSMYLIGYYV